MMQIILFAERGLNMLQFVQRQALEHLELAYCNL